MRRLMVLGALASASMQSRKASTSATETVKSRVDSSGQRMSEEADEVHDVLAVGPLGVQALPPRDPALEDFRDRAVESSDLGLDRRGVPTGEDRRQLGPRVAHRHQLRLRSRP